MKSCLQLTSSCYALSLLVAHAGRLVIVVSLGNIITHPSFLQVCSRSCRSIILVLLNLENFEYGTIGIRAEVKPSQDYPGRWVLVDRIFYIQFPKAFAKVI